jgi:tRNA(Met) C34 N-acetyltransferase TmcA
MKCMVIDEAASCHKEQVGIMLIKSRESIESNTVHGHEDQSGET